MEAAEVVVAALEAGLAAGVKDSATIAVKDSYAALAAAVRKILSLKAPYRDADVVEAPAERRDELVTALTEAGIDAKSDLVEQAHRLLTAVDPTGSRAGKYSVQVRDSKGVQVGDNNTMTLNF